MLFLHFISSFDGNIKMYDMIWWTVAFTTRFFLQKKLWIKKVPQFVLPYKSHLFYTYNHHIIRTCSRYQTFPFSYNIQWKNSLKKHTDQSFLFIRFQFTLPFVVFLFFFLYTLERVFIKTFLFIVHTPIICELQ